jgi:branched-chain amino acid transport system ATP-binding protein
MRAAESSALTARGLVVGYVSGRDVLRDVSMEVGPGGAVALLGPNGAGKTTLLRALSGLVRPRSGTVELGGIDLTRLAPHAIARVGVAHVPQGKAIFVRQTVRDNLLLGAMRSDDASERMGTVLASFPALVDRLDSLGGELSGGQQQMLAIARALMSRPRVLLLDEPSLGLAPRLVDGLVDVLAALRRSFRTSLVIAEQNLQLAVAIADRAYVMRRGQIALERPSRDVPTDPDLLAAYFG